MSETTIEWTATVNADGTVTPGSTWNPVRGCTKVSPGCAHCYAETFAERFRGVKGHPYEQGFDLRLVPEKLTEPFSWKKPRRVFVNSMSDLFQDGVPDSFLDQAFAVMAMCPQHTFQVLTKRPERMRDYCQKFSRAWKVNAPGGENVIGLAPSFNIWLGVSVENQHFADERIPVLLQTPAAVRFISAEPLLGPVELVPYVRADVPSGPLSGLEFCPRCGSGPRQEADTVECPDCGYLWSGPRLLDLATGQQTRPVLDWVIVGGESGNKARPFDIAWARSIVAQCKAAGVACFVKQLGAEPWVRTANHYGKGVDAAPYNVRYQLKSKKGGDMSEWPEDLRVREFPEMVPA